MGTNYYVKSTTCSHCGHKPEQLHIGKSSGGWTFTFHATDECQSFSDWKEYLKDKEIVNEYGDRFSLERFIELVKTKAYAENNHTTYCQRFHPGDRSFLDAEGHSFSWGDFS